TAPLEFLRHLLDSCNALDRAYLIQRYEDDLKILFRTCSSMSLFVASGQRRHDDFMAIVISDSASLETACHRMNRSPYGDDSDGF
ncbi:hypothetical protein PENTCL1PPCAC_23927, partial [Pristionchus entomophagus]